jgi:hypothetical protein
LPADLEAKTAVLDAHRAAGVRAVSEATFGRL